MFNDGAFHALTEKDTRDASQIRLQARERIRFGVDGCSGVAMGSDGALRIVDVAGVGEQALLVHGPGWDDPGLAFLLAKLFNGPTGPTPIGVFRPVSRPVYGAAPRPRVPPPSTGWLSYCSGATPDRRLTGRGPLPTARPVEHPAGMLCASQPAWRSARRCHSRA
jgi:hypothetical protein